MIFTCDDHYRPANATWARDLCNYSGSLMGKTREKRQSKAKYANVPVVTTVFIGKWALISIFDSQKGGLIGETKIPMQELEPKV